MPKTRNPQQENLGTIIEGNYSSSTSNLGTTCLQKTRFLGHFVSASILLCAVSMMSSLQPVFDEVVLPTSAEEIISPAFWNLCPTSGIENEFFLS